jgi:hypothetical protein
LNSFNLNYKNKTKVSAIGGCAASAKNNGVSLIIENRPETTSNVIQGEANTEDKAILRQAQYKNQKAKVKFKIKGKKF